MQCTQTTHKRYSSRSSVASVSCPHCRRRVRDRSTSRQRTISEVSAKEANPPREPCHVVLRSRKPLVESCARALSNAARTRTRTLAHAPHIARTCGATAAVPPHQPAFHKILATPSVRRAPCAAASSPPPVRCLEPSPPPPMRRSTTTTTRAAHRTRCCVPTCRRRRHRNPSGRRSCSRRRPQARRAPSACHSRATYLPVLQATIAAEGREPRARTHTDARSASARRATTWKEHAKGGGWRAARARGRPHME